MSFHFGKQDSAQGMIHNQDAGAIEMLVYEEIGENWFGNGVTAKSIKEQLDAVTVPYSKIQLRINSPGGDAFEGTAIYNLLRSQKKPIEVYVDGIAASAASIIAMCGDTITMGHNAMMMIHDAWGVCMGNAKDMRKQADVLEKVSDSIAQTYVDRTGKSMDEVNALMDAETWMTADECVKEGFATDIAEMPQEPSALARARRFKALSRFQKLPTQLKSDTDACQCKCDACQNGDCQNCSVVDCMDENCMNCPMQAKTKSKTQLAANSPAECECECEACQQGDCSNCSMMDCNDPNCKDCPMQEQASENKKKAAADFDLCEAVWQARQRGIDARPPEAIWEARQTGTDVANQQQA